MRGDGKGLVKCHHESR